MSEKKFCLVVDDSKIVRKVCVDMLASLGFEIAEAGNGQEAYDYCMQTKMPDFILLDWNMPVMDGLSFINKFRQEKLANKVLIIFCTTENDVEKISQAIEAGADEYIMKPFNKDILQEKLVQIGLF